MKIIKSIVILFLLCGSVRVFADEVSIPLRGTRFISYYQAPVLKNYPATLIVTFYGGKPSRAQLDKFLREQLRTAILIEGKNDILATAWFSSSGREEDEEMLEISGKNIRALIYNAADKKITPHS